MIVVTGATGNVGRELVNELVRAGAKVCALTRDPDTARLPDAVRVARTGDLPLDGVTSVFLHMSVVGDDPGDFVRRLAWHGARRVVTLSSASVLGVLDTPEGAAGDTAATGRNAIGLRHRALERAVEDAGLEWTHLRPGAFDANAYQWAPQLRQGDVVYGPYADARTAPIHEADIAAVAARALLSDDHVGEAPELSGPESLSHADQVRIIGEVIGRPVRYQEVPPETAREQMLAHHVPADVADSLLGLFASVVGRPAEISGEVQRTTGRAPRTFAEWVEDHVAAFR